MKILIYTTHRTGSTSLANFLMFNYSYDYQRHNYFNNNCNNLPNDIIIKLTPKEEHYDNIKHLFDKRIVLIREDIREQAESVVYSQLEKKVFQSYTMTKSFLIDNSELIESQIQIIMKQNELLRKCDDCFIITYEELYTSNIGIIKLENYLNIKFKYTLQYKRYRDMNQNII
jgi:hypothetical protein